MRIYKGNINAEFKTEHCKGISIDHDIRKVSIAVSNIYNTKI